MGTLILFLIIIVAIVFSIRNRHDLPKMYEKAKNNIGIIKTKLQSELFKNHALSEDSRRKLFGQTDVKQGYDKNEALHSDKSLDPFKQSLDGQDAYKYSNNAQIVHSNSAFTQQHVVKQPKNPEVKTATEEMGVDTKLDKNNVANLDIEKASNPVAYRTTSSGGRMKV
ncbi:MAG: hypothetical protein RLZZ210_845 [Pseudomonadota bacterium]|jgi:hypothetical protein